ncbi:MAG: PAS domain S-box protein [Deltaproteobacteria bacterium]|nr:PAS domain S-box protein [Deltaproteobacteria bacterium]
MTMIKEGNLSVNMDGVIIRSGESIKDVLGFSEEELFGKDFISLSTPGMEESNKAIFENVKTAGAVIAAGSVIGSKIGLRKKDGTDMDIFVSVYPLRDRSGSLYAFMLVLNTERASRVPGILSEEFQRIFRFSNDAVAVTDKAGHIMDVNQSFLDTYGYKREEVLGKNPRVLKSQHSTPELYERMWKDILDPDRCFWRGEIINLTKDGKEVPVLLSINAIKDETGEIKNFLGIAFNMKRQKELDRINRMYIDHIVHDLRGPLTSIMTSAELLMMQLESAINEKQKKRIEALIRGAQKLNTMTSDILDFSRAQSGSLVLKKERVALSGIIKEAALPFQSSEKKLFLNGSVYTEDFEDNTELEADSDKLQRAIYNLLSNAFKHAASEVRIAVDHQNGALTITVSDDGKGITALEAERIFDAFYQTEEGIKTGGAGLGLNIVKSFVEAHGGRIWVEPGVPIGATFGFSIPAG